MHPKVMRRVMQFRPDSELPNLVGGEVGPDCARRLLNVKDREIRKDIPDIAHY